MSPLGRPPVAAATRFWFKVIKTDTCWEWTGSLNKGGYGTFRPDPNAPSIPAHAWAYADANGPIPEGKVLDHQCHDPQVCHLGRQCPHRRCVNPAHLTTATRSENMAAMRQSSYEARRTHCPQKHPYDEQNTYWTPDGRRQCRTCRHDWVRRYRAKNRAA